MAAEEPVCARASICLSLFLYYELLTRTCLSGSSFIFLSFLGFRVGSSLFGIPFVKPFLFVDLYFSMSILGVGLWASSGPFPLSAHYGLYKRGRDPPTNPSRHLKKERSELPLKWLLKEDRRRRPTAARRCAAAVPATETAASSCIHHALSRWITAQAAASGRRRRRLSGLLCHHNPTTPPPPSSLLHLHHRQPSSLSLIT